MGYWQNGLEIEKKGMLPYGNAALIRVKTLHTNFENVIFELSKRYIRTLKTLYPNFENVISDQNLNTLTLLQTAQLIKPIKSVTSSVLKKPVL